MTYQIDDESKKGEGSKDAALPTGALSGPPSDAAPSKPAASETEPIGLVADPETDSRNWPLEPKKVEAENYEVGEPVALPVSLRIKEIAAKQAADAAAAAEAEAILAARRAATPGYQAPAPATAPQNVTSATAPPPVGGGVAADPVRALPPRPIRPSKPVPITDEKSERFEAFLIKVRQPTIFSPLVGTFVGLGTATLVTIGWMYWPLWLAAAVGLTAEMVITGAIYENGVAKFTDAFWRARTGEDMYEILQSTSVGGYGAAGLIFAILLRTMAIGAIVAPAAANARSGWEVMAAIIGSATLGRWITLAIMATLPAMDDAISGVKDLPHRISIPQLGQATLLAIPGMLGFLWLFPQQTFISLAILIFTVPMFINFIRRTLGAYTPECLGFGCYIGQVVVLLAAAMYRHVVIQP